VVLKGHAHTVRAGGRGTLAADGDAVKALADHALQRVEVLAAGDGELHAARAVLLLPPLDELLAGVAAGGAGLLPQGLEVTGAELAVDVPGLGERLLELERTPAVVLDVLLVLRVDGLDLAFCAVLREEGLAEEAREAVQRALERVGRHVKVVVGVAHGGPRVALAVVGREVRRVLVLGRELESAGRRGAAHSLGSHEHQVLAVGSAHFLVLRAYQKWAQPGRSTGSDRWPTPTSMDAAALSDLGSDTMMTSSPLGRVKWRCARSSVGGTLILTSPEAVGMGGGGGKSMVGIGTVMAGDCSARRQRGTEGGRSCVL
jgi:hypothetical protein